MTVEIGSPIIIAALVIALVESVVSLFVLWRRMRRIEDHRNELIDQTNMQGDALREALNEIDRLRPGR